MASTASKPLPTFAPSTRPSAAVTGRIAEVASVAVSSTIARLEYEKTASTAPTTMSSMMSCGSAVRSARTAADSVSGRVAATMSCRARVISPSPIRTRPIAAAPPFCCEMKVTTPTKISSGESHDRSNENTTAIRLVPMSAPSITASAALVVTRPLPTKEATIRQVAVLDCTMLVTPNPAATACSRLLKLLARTRRRFSPSTRSMPVRTMCVPQTSSAIAASRFSRWSMGGSAFRIHCTGSEEPEGLVAPAPRVIETRQATIGDERQALLGHGVPKAGSTDPEDRLSAP